MTTATLPFNMQHGADSKSLSSFELAAVEKHHIQKVLQHTNGNKTEAARLMGIGLTTLYGKIEEYKLEA